MYSCLSSQNIFEKSVQYSEGTKMPVIKWKDFKNFEIILPSENKRKAFSNLTRPLFQKIIQNIFEEELTVDLIENCLPILLSGNHKFN